MIIIGVITIALLIPLQSAPSSYSGNSRANNNSLGANAYNADYSGSDNNSIFGTQNNSRYPYQPVIIRSYPTSNTTYSGTGSYTTTTTTTMSGQNTDDNYYYYNNNDYSNYQGYVPAGCESGADYSFTTGEPCG
jgi:hypothetical protein